MIQQSHFWVCIQTNYNSKRSMNPNVHTGTVHNSQDMEQSKCLLTEEWIKM